MKKVAFLFILSIITFSCADNDDMPNEVLGCTDATSINYNPEANTNDGTCIFEKNATFNFTQNWDGQSFSIADFNTTEFENATGNMLTISKLRYLISDIKFHKADGSFIAFEEYNLIDLQDSTTVSLTPTKMVETGDYTGISFIYGFSDEKNISGAYPDLNAATWNWPDMLGGGYHFLQLEGSFDDVNGDPKPYAYHNGTARVSQGNFESNYIAFNFEENFTISENTTIEIKMNIAEWYKNPINWDLNDRSIDLMMNYQAQIDMHHNGLNVFSIGNITQ